MTVALAKWSFVSPVVEEVVLVVVVCANAAGAANTSSARPAVAAMKLTRRLTAIIPSGPAGTRPSKPTHLGIPGQHRRANRSSCSSIPATRQCQVWDSRGQIT